MTLSVNLNTNELNTLIITIMYNLHNCLMHVLCKIHNCIMQLLKFQWEQKNQVLCSYLVTMQQEETISPLSFLVERHSYCYLFLSDMILETGL